MVVADVHSKLRLALGSVKDHASIGKAMIYNRDGLSCSIDIAVVRATGHDHNAPMDDKHLHEILFLVSNSPGSVPHLAERISHRLHRTRDPIVALKTLVLVHRLLRGGNRKFERDLRNAHLSGHLQLIFTTNIACRRGWCFPANYISSSKYSSSSSATLLFSNFLHSYAAFLEERMSWVINQAGKLEPVMFQGLMGSRFHEEKSMEMVFHRLPRCQVFLDKVLGCSPLVLEMFPSDCLITWVAMRNILRESFQVYATFSEGVATLADSFFNNFNYPARVLALEVLRKASSQSYELCNFFDECKTIIGTKNGLQDYPFVEIIPRDHVSAMDQFLLHSPTPSRNTKLTGATTITGSSPCEPWSLRKPISYVKSQAAGNNKTICRDHELIQGQVMKTSAGTSNLSPPPPPPFPRRVLETKISTVWVVFDDEEEKQASNFTLETADRESCWGMDERAYNIGCYWP